MNGPFPHGGGSWSPAKSPITDKTEAPRQPRGLRPIFAIALIAGVALLTAGAVAMLFVEPSQSAADKTPAIDVGPPVATASLSPKPMLPPVRKVVTMPVRVAIRRATQAVSVDAVTVEASETLERQDPRWARSGSERSAIDVASMVQPHALARENGIAATGAVVLFDPEAETAAIEPDQVKPSRASKTKPGTPAAETDTLPPGFKASTRTVQINRGVNMHSRPQSGSSVLTVVPRAANIKLVGCKVWCEVLYKGRHGYVFKDFVGGRARPPVKPKSAKEATAAKETRTVSTSKAAQGSVPSEPPRVKATPPRLQ